MQYDKFLISLYQHGGFIPQLFVVFNKRAGDVVIKVEQGVFKKGWLYVFSDNKISSVEIVRMGQESVLHKEFKFESDYYLAYFTNDKFFVGCKGNIKNKEKVLIKFKEMQNEKIKAYKNTDVLLDKNHIVDLLIKKMFGRVNICFFEQTKNQLFCIFKNSSRYEELEKIIPFSKFIKTGMDGDESYIGIVYKNNIPYALGIGRKVDDEHYPIDGNEYQFFYNKADVGAGKVKNGYLLCFRRASDGDNIIIN